MMLVAGLGRDESAPDAEIHQRRAVGLATLARGVEREMQHAMRNLDCRERTSVDFAEHGRAQPMRLEPLSVPDHRLGAHGAPRRMQDGLWQDRASDGQKKEHMTKAATALPLPLA